MREKRSSWLGFTRATRDDSHTLITRLYLSYRKPECVYVDHAAPHARRCGFSRAELAPYHP